MGKRAKAKTAQQIAAELLARKRTNFGAVNLPPEAAELPKQADIEIIRSGEKREEQRVDSDSARRLDAFESLRPSMRAERYVGCYDAARRYELQLLIRRGENDRGPSSERVDRTAGFTTDAMMIAAEWLEAVNKRLPQRDWWLLMELVNPTREWANWRATVAFITGEMHINSQGAVVRAMTVNLRDSIEIVDAAAAAAAEKERARKRAA